MIELKSCPFCGKEAQLYVNNGGVTVRCKECLCQTPIYTDAYSKSETHAVEYAIKSWNRRTEPPINLNLDVNGFSDYTEFE